MGSVITQPLIWFALMKHSMQALKQCYRRYMTQNISYPMGSYELNRPFSPLSGGAQFEIKPINLK